MRNKIVPCLALITVLVGGPVFAYEPWASPSVREAAQRVEIVSREIQHRAEAAAHPRFAQDAAALARLSELARAARDFHHELGEDAAKPYLAVKAFERLEKAYFEALGSLDYLRFYPSRYQDFERLDASMSWLSFYYAFRYAPGYARNER